MGHSYKVKIDNFEGPLDLLLHLVNQMEIDIYEIPVAEITNQYIEFIQAMERIELNIASEYLVMAASLLEIKSATLLPKKEVPLEDDTYEEDPREQLIQRLIEYRKYKEAAEQLEQKELEENEIFTRPPANFDELLEQAPKVSGEVSVYDMLHAVNKMLKRKAWNRPLETTVHREEISIEERIDEVLEMVSERKEPLLFEDLFPYPTRGYIVITLLAILQLLKTNDIVCKQASHFEPIYVYRKEHQ